MSYAKLQEHLDFVNGGTDLFEGFDRGDGPAQWAEEQRARNEADEEEFKLIRSREQAIVDDLDDKADRIWEDERADKPDWEDIEF